MFLSFIFGILSHSWYINSSSKKVVINKLNNEKKPCINEVKKYVKEKIIEKLPYYIKEDLEKYEIDSLHLNRIKWESFLKKLKKDNINNLKLFDGENILDIAVKSSNKKFVEYLLSLDFDINQKGEGNLSPIKLAIKNGDIDMIKFLHENGAMLEDGSEKEFDLIVYALLNIKNEYKKDEIIDYLSSAEGFSLKKNAQKYFQYVFNGVISNRLKDTIINNINPSDNIDENYDNLEYAIKNNLDNETLEKMISNYDFENIKKDGLNLLHVSAMNRSLSDENFKYILEKSASFIDKTDTIGFTPLMHAVNFMNKKKIKILLENGAEINTINVLDENVFDILESKKDYISKKDLYEIKELLNENNK